MTSFFRRHWPALLGAPIAAAALASPARAQLATAPAITPPIAYASVAAAMQDLRAREGRSTVVTHADGWTIINEPMATAQWSFAPAGHAAYPAVVRRVIRRAQGREVAVDTDTLCEGPPAACDALAAEFAKLNERIMEAARARIVPGSRPVN